MSLPACPGTGLENALVLQSEETFHAPGIACAVRSIRKTSRGSSRDVLVRLMFSRKATAETDSYLVSSQCREESLARSVTIAFSPTQEGTKGRLYLTSWQKSILCIYAHTRTHREYSAAKEKRLHNLLVLLSTLYFIVVSSWNPTVLKFFNLFSLRFYSTTTCTYHSAIRIE